MSSWEEARAQAEAEAGPPPAPQPGPPPLALVVVDHFDLSMIDMQSQGARLLVRPVSRLEALSFVRECRERFAVCAMNERGQGLLERELQLEASWRPKVTAGTRLLVVNQVRWNDVRWFLVEYECDGDGCIP